MLKRLAAVLALAFAGGSASLPAVADTVSTFGQATTAWNPQISADGDLLAMGCSRNGRASVCLYPFDRGEPTLFVLEEGYEIGHFYWASDQHLIVEVMFTETVTTRVSREDYLFLRALSYDVETGDTAIMLHTRRNFTNLTDIAAICPERPDIVAMELTVRASEAGRAGTRLTPTNRGFNTLLYHVDLEDGDARLIDNSRAASVIGNVLDDNCDAVARVLFDDQRGTFSIEMAEDGRVIYNREGVRQAPLWVLGRTPDGDGLIVRVDDGISFGLHELSVHDGSMSPVLHEGRTIGNPGLIFDRDFERVVGYRFTNDLTEQFFTEPFLAEVHSAMSGLFPGKIVTLDSWTADYDAVALSVRAPGQPADYYLFTLADGNVAPLGGEAPHLAGQALPAPERVTYAARDGLSISGYLTLPPGRTQEDGPFPLVLVPHGGPEARTTAEYDWLAQALAGEGYAVLAPNFRGSYGFGAAFRNAGHGEFGGAMITDMIDGGLYLQAEGVASSEGVCILGASYGGYAALMAPLLDPETIGCSVAINPVTDIFEHMGEYGSNTSGYNYWAQYVGQDTFARRELRQPVTPAARTGEYRSPVLILHGDDDMVVSARQSEVFARNWGTRPGLRYVEMDGEGHSLFSQTARTTVLTESLAFLAASHPARQ